MPNYERAIEGIEQKLEEFFDAAGIAKQDFPPCEHDDEDNPAILIGERKQKFEDKIKEILQRNRLTAADNNFVNNAKKQEDILDEIIKEAIMPVFAELDDFKLTEDNIKEIKNEIEIVLVEEKVFQDFNM